MRQDRTEVLHQSAITRLYGGPLADFIRARDHLARELRAAGDRDAAASVKSLRKPSRPAWALNRAVHHDPASLSALEAAVAHIVDAHGGAADVRTAMAALRGAIRDHAGVAAEESTRAAFSLDIGVLSNAILAVLGNPVSYEEFRSGRLTDIPEAGGLDFLTSLSARPKLEVSGVRSPSPPDVDPEEIAAVREQARQACEVLERARAAAEAAATMLNEAESEVTAAGERARLAESELKAAQQRREFARRTQASASAELRKAEAACREADSALQAIGPVT